MQSVPCHITWNPWNNWWIHYGLNMEQTWQSCWETESTAFWIYFPIHEGGHLVLQETLSLCKTSSISGALNVMHVGIRILFHPVYGSPPLPVWSCGHACLTGPLIDVYSTAYVTCTPFKLLQCTVTECHNAPTLLITLIKHILISEKKEDNTSTTWAHN